MRSIILTLMVSLLSLTGTTQDIVGEWNGLLSVSGIQIRLTFNVTRQGDVYSSTLDSPDQKVMGIPVESTSFDGSEIKFVMTKLSAEYIGKLGEKGFTGNFTQMGKTIPMNLSREKVEKTVLKRPQEPTPPYAYYTEDVKFKNEKEKVTLAGTLTLPSKDGNYPIVILISGSGPQNRNEELMGHKPFLVLADYLTKNGIGVLRYDDRGTNESEGNFGTCTSQNFATDVDAAIKYLLTRKEANKNKIGLIGHSEGGLIAPMVAAKNKHVAYIIMLAGPGISGGDILLLQQELIGRANGAKEEDIAETKALNTAAYQIISKSKDAKSAKTELADFYKKTIEALPENERPTQEEMEEGISSQINQITGPWFYNFIKYDPFPTLKKVKCPVLALNGEKDLQVPPKENLKAIKEGLELAKNKNFTTKELPNLNHLFQECTTGSPNEYANIEQTMSPIVLNEVVLWIKNITK